MGALGTTPQPWYSGQSPYQRENYPSQRSIALAIEPDGTPFGYRLAPDDDDGAYLNMSGHCSEADAHQIAASGALYDALTDMLAGWKYIRQVHGDLSGVGWDRAEDAATNALRLARGEKVS